MSIERNELKEVADIARNQILALECKKKAENLELEALRHQVIDLQTQTDEKAVIAKLHRTIVGLQLRENDIEHKLQLSNSKFGRLEAQLLRYSKKCDEKEDMLIHVRSEGQIKCRSLLKMIQDLRRQYSGSIPLSRQEKLSQLMKEMNDEKRRLVQCLRVAEEKQNEAEIKAEEWAIKQASIDDIVKNKGRSSMEWQKKLEQVRLREMRWRRSAENVTKEVDHLRSLCHNQQTKIDQLEEELLRNETLLEQRQLDWETREVELENLQEAKKPSNQEHSLPDPDLPLSRQLEQALDSLKSSNHSNKDLQQKVNDLKCISEDAQKKLRESESMVLAKDKIINDLRLQVPTSVDRAVAMATITGGPSMAMTEDYESKHALDVAQATVSSLRERLAQKEETLKRYESLLKQSRTEAEDLATKLQSEIVDLKSSLQSQQKAYSDLRNSSAEIGSTAPELSFAAISDKIEKIQELEEEIIELKGAMNEISRQLAVAKSEASSHLHDATMKQKELNDFRENTNVENQMRSRQNQQEVDGLKNEIAMLKSENNLLQDDLRNAKIAQEKAPSAVMSALVEKLRNDLAEKDKKQRAMARALADLKQEIISKAEKESDVVVEESPIEKELRKKNEMLNAKVEKYHKQVNNLKDKETTYANELKIVREELSKKTSMLIKMKEDKVKSPSNTITRSQGDQREKQELKATIRSLEMKLKAVNKPEKPFAEETADVDDKVVRTAEDLARWDESKKWHKKTEALRAKIANADEEVSRLSKSNKSLRDVVSRLEREKLILDGKVKTAARDAQIKNNMLTVKVDELNVENKKLTEHLTNIQHNQLMEGQKGLETLKLRNKFLQERIEQQEKKISSLELTKKLAGSKAEITNLVKKMEEMQEKERDVVKQLQKLQEENTKLKLEVEKSPMLDTIQGSLAEIIDSLKQENDPSKSTLQLELQKLLDSFGKNPPSKPPLVSKKTAAVTKELTDEVIKLKDINQKLITKLEDKAKIIENLEKDLLLERRKNATSSSRSSEDKLQKEKSMEYVSPPLSQRIIEQLPNVDEIRKMEADLKRKSDLLSEVKILLKQAAERERSILAEKEGLASQIKLLLEVNPKSPSEVLAKELRQARLTIDRLNCEKRELQHKVSVGV